MRAACTSTAVMALILGKSTSKTNENIIVVTFMFLLTSDWRFIDVSQRTNTYGTVQLRQSKGVFLESGWGGCEMLSSVRWTYQKQPTGSRRRHDLENSLLIVELALVSELDLKVVPSDCRDFIRLIYISKLNKVTRSQLRLIIVQTPECLHGSGTDITRFIRTTRKCRSHAKSSKSLLCKSPIFQMSQYNRRVSSQFNLSN